MKRIIVQEYNDSNLLVADSGMSEYRSNDEEVLSGIPNPAYVNFSNASGGNGTSGNPLGLAEFVSNIAAGGNWLARGQGEVTNSPITFTGTIDAWDAANYYPWRLYFHELNVSTGSSFKNGIIQARFIQPNSSSNSVTLTDMYLTGYDPTVALVGPFYNQNGITFTLKGCTIVATKAFGNVVVMSTWALSLLDCVVSGDLLNANKAAVTADKCVFTGSSWDAVPGITNSQFGWTPPAWPAWDALRSTFASSTLSNGITTPIPRTGNSPYTNYDKGLWGSNRTGIGAMDFLTTTKISTFSAPTVVDGASVTSTVDLSGTVTAIQAVGSDTYFDSTAEVARVDVYYTHSAGRQKKRLVHQYPGFAAGASWSSFAKDGTWAKTKVRAFDWEGAKIDLDGTNIPSGENLTHADGTMNLNT